MNQLDNTKLDTFKIDETWEDVRKLRGGYDSAASNPFECLESPTLKTNCLSFALLHQALTFHDPEVTPILGLFRATDISDGSDHFLNLSMAFAPLPRILYDRARKAELDSEDSGNIIRLPQKYKSHKAYRDFMMSVAPGETEYGERIEVDGYKFTYCNPEYVLGCVCSDERLTLSGLAEAARNRLAEVERQRDASLANA